MVSRRDHRFHPTRHRRSATLSFLGCGVSAAFTAWLTLFLVRALRSSAHGVFALTVGISDLVLLPADAGLSGAGARFIAQNRGDSASSTQLVVGSRGSSQAAPVCGDLALSERAILRLRNQNRCRIRLRRVPRPSNPCK